VGLFGGDSLSGVGFGMGDVTLVEFLRGHNLLPSSRRRASVMLALFSDTEHKQVWSIARLLRNQGISVEVPWGLTKLGKQFQSAEKKGLRYIILPDAEEMAQNRVLLKDLYEQRQFPVAIEKVVDYVSSKE
jgi:histidyl-tRNA synthetase